MLKFTKLKSWSPHFRKRSDAWKLCYSISASITLHRQWSMYQSAYTFVNGKVILHESWLQQYSYGRKVIFKLRWYSILFFFFHYRTCLFKKFVVYGHKFPCELNLLANCHCHAKSLNHRSHRSRPYMWIWRWEFSKNNFLKRKLSIALSVSGDRYSLNSSHLPSVQNVKGF